PATASNLICVAYPDGRAPARYRRTHPNGPWIYTGGPAWELQWGAVDELPVFDTAHGKVGLAMCSEVYMPEVARALALRGAELIFMPAGKDKNKLWATWRALIWARAIENLAIVVTTQNLFDHSERGLAMVASPEEILFESTIAGTTVVDVSLERVRYLRATRDEVGSSQHCAGKQGVLGPPWLRPVRYSGDDFNGIFDGLGKRSYDAVISGTTITPERAAIVLFSQPYLEFNQGVAVNREVTPNAASAADLRGLTAGIQSGNTSD